MRDILAHVFPFTLQLTLSCLHHLLLLRHPCLKVLCLISGEQGYRKWRKESRLAPQPEVCSLQASLSRIMKPLSRLHRQLLRAVLPLPVTRTGQLGHNVGGTLRGPVRRGRHCGSHRCPQLKYVGPRSSGPCCAIAECTKSHPPCLVLLLPVTQGGFPRERQRRARKALLQPLLLESHVCRNTSQWTVSRESNLHTVTRPLRLLQVTCLISPLPWKVTILVSLSYECYLKD